VKADLAYAGSLERALETLAHLTALERVTCMRVPKHEIALGLVRGGLEEQLKLTSDAIGHRYSA
jgi:hypothetical protein